MAAEAGADAALAGPAAGDVSVQRAFRVGWRFAQLYRHPYRATLDRDERDWLPDHLPSFSRLSDGNRAEMILREVAHDIEMLKPDWAPGGASSDSVSTLATTMRGQVSADSKKEAILETYRRFRIEIGAEDARLGRAVDLGRMLADTVILANSGGSDRSYLAEFEPYRLQHAYERLEDLHSSFPRHAADAVRGSLECWAQWIGDSASARGGEEDARVKRALTQQGERWRRLLSGEILADDLLAADSYRSAVSNYLGRIARLAWAFARRFWLVILLVLGGTGAVIAVIVKYAPTGAASVAALIATAAGSLGISWKTVGSTLGKAAAMAEQPLWNAEVLEAIVVATFIPPVEMNGRDVASLRRKATSAPKELPPVPPHQLAPAASGAPPPAAGQPAAAPAAQGADR